jgi:hypothetical protein
MNKDFVQREKDGVECQYFVHQDSYFLHGRLNPLILVVQEARSLNLYRGDRSPFGIELVTQHRLREITQSKIDFPCPLNIQPGFGRRSVGPRGRGTKSYVQPSEISGVQMSASELTMKDDKFSFISDMCCMKFSLTCAHFQVHERYECL